MPMMPRSPSLETGRWATSIGSTERSGEPGLAPRGRRYTCPCAPPIHKSPPGPQYMLMGPTSSAATSSSMKPGGRFDAETGVEAPRPTTRAKPKKPRRIMYLKRQERTETHRSLPVIEKSERWSDFLQLAFDISVLSLKPPAARKTVSHGNPNRSTRIDLRLDRASLESKATGLKARLGEPHAGPIAATERGVDHETDGRGGKAEGAEGGTAIDSALLEI